jgi:hypothetical protein
MAGAWRLQAYRGLQEVAAGWKTSGVNRDGCGARYFQQSARASEGSAGSSPEMPGYDHGVVDEPLASRCHFRQVQAQGESGRSVPRSWTFSSTRAPLSLSRPPISAPSLANRDGQPYTGPGLARINSSVTLAAPKRAAEVASETRNVPGSRSRGPSRSQIGRRLLRTRAAARPSVGRLSSATSKRVNSGSAASSKAGCAALLNLRVAAAAAGLGPDIRLLPDPGQPLLLAGIRLIGRHHPTRWEGELHAAIWRRQTNREPFSSRPVPPGVRAEMAEAACLEGASLAFLDRDEAARVLSLAAEAERHLLADRGRGAPDDPADRLRPAPAAGSAQASGGRRHRPAVEPGRPGLLTWWRCRAEPGD